VEERLLLDRVISDREQGRRTAAAGMTIMSLS